MKPSSSILFLLICLYTELVFCKIATKETKQIVEKMTLTISYPEKVSHFQFIKSHKKENELNLIINEQKVGDRKLSKKDLLWLENRLASFDYDSRVPNLKCELGEVTLFVKYPANEKRVKRCIGAKDNTTTKLLTLTKTLRTFL